MARVKEWPLFAHLSGKEPTMEQRADDKLRIETMHRAVRIQESLRSGKTAPEVLTQFNAATPQVREEVFYYDAALNINRGVALFEAFNPDEVRSDAMKAALFRQAIRNDARNGTLEKSFARHRLPDKSQVMALIKGSDKDISQWMSDVVSQSRTLGKVGDLDGQAPRKPMPSSATSAEAKKRKFNDELGDEIPEQSSGPSISEGNSLSGAFQRQWKLSNREKRLSICHPDTDRSL